MEIKDGIIIIKSTLSQSMTDNKEVQLIQTFGRKKTAVATATATKGKGTIRINGKAADLVEPKSLRLKVYEPVLLVGADKFKNLSINVRVTGGGQHGQILAIRQAIARALVSYYQKYEDEASKAELKDLFLQYDRNLITVDNRRCEPKKFGGPGARARYQKSYR